jgi:hypothetical protein
VPYTEEQALAPEPQQHICDERCIGEIEKTGKWLERGCPASDDAALLDWLEAHRFTAYTATDPANGMRMGYTVLVNEELPMRTGILGETLRDAIRAAMRAEDK